MMNEIQTGGTLINILTLFSIGSQYINNLFST